MTSMAFTGLAAEAFDFYEALNADNSKAFWADHKDEYLEFVREPLQELAAALEPRYGPAHLYRPYRDLRFSKDKTPYKDHQGMYFEHRNGLGYYLQVSSRGLMAAGGWYSSTPEQVARYREAVDDDDQGRLRRLLDDAEAAGMTIDGDRLKTRPRGVPADHPRLELLRFRSLYLWRSWEPSPWMGTDDALERVVGQWRAMEPALDWLASVVGPGEPPVGSRR